MKKFALIVAACTLSFVSVASYANMGTAKDSERPCNGKIEKFTAPNLIDNPRITNK